MVIKNYVKSADDFYSHEITQRSINPGQYDCLDLNWNPEKKDLSSPIRGLMFRNIIFRMGESTGKAVLEIGCGTGWLVNEISKFIPAFVEGIDPSKINIKIARSKHPELEFRCENFKSFCARRKYDTIYSIMVLSHIWDLEAFFKKCFALLNNNGHLVVIVPDFEFFKNPRKGQDTKLVFFEDSYSVCVSRDGNLLSQIVRRDEVYQSTAMQAGFKETRQKSIKVDRELSDQVSRYQNCIGVTIFSLLDFVK